jgi:hypothetical protein
MKSWIVMWLFVIASLLAMTSIVDAGWIYDVEGITGPTLVNSVSTSFRGEVEFPDLSTEGELRISLDNEQDPVTGDPIVRIAPFSMAANMMTPIGTRLFYGEWDNQPFSMLWLDFDGTAATDFLAMNLEDGGEWDAWGVGFHDYQLGTFTSISNGREVPQVNEPGGLVLALIAGMGLLGTMRRRRVA